MFVVVVDGAVSWCSCCSVIVAGAWVSRCCCCCCDCGCVCGCCCCWRIVVAGMFALLFVVTIIGPTTPTKMSLVLVMLPVGGATCRPFVVVMAAGEIILLLLLLFVSVDG